MLLVWKRNSSIKDRTTGSRLFERGLNLIEVSSASGHKELRMLKTYTHLSADNFVGRLG